MRDGATNTIFITECAGRPALWQAGKEIANAWLSGGRGLRWRSVVVAAAFAA